MMSEVCQSRGQLARCTTAVPAMEVYRVEENVREVDATVLSQIIQAVEVLQVPLDLELRGKPVRSRSIQDRCNAGAAPATVGGEPASTKVTEANASGRPDAGDDPRARRPAPTT